MSREWAPKIVRDQIRGQIQACESVEGLAQLLLEMDKGFSDPVALKYKEGKFQSDDEQEEEGMEDEQAENSANKKSKNGDEDKFVKRTKIQFFKYWPSKSLRQSWRNFLFTDVKDECINGLYICVKLLEKVNEQYV